MHLFSLFITSCILFPLTWAAQISFIGPTNTLSSWTDPAIWNTHTVPTSQDTVILNQHAYIQINSATTINTLIVNSGASLYFNTTDPLADLPILTMKGLGFGSTPITSPIVLDGVILQISSLIDTSSVIMTSNPTILTFQNYASLTLLSSGIAHFQSNSSMSIEFSDASSVFDGIVSIVGNITMSGAVQFYNIDVAANSALTVNGEFGMFSGATTLGPSSSLNLRAKCSIDTNATITGPSSSSITSDGIHHFIGTIHIDIPITVLTGVTTFTQQVTLNHVIVQSDATLAIDNNATISSLLLYDNATIGTFSITQSHAGIGVQDMIGNNNFNIHGVNLVSLHTVNISSSSPITIELSQNATWVWYIGSVVTSNTDVTISTPDNTTSRIMQSGNITIPVLTIHVCYTNTTNNTINGQLILDIPPTLVCITNTTNIIIPTVAPTTAPTTEPTGEPIQGVSSSSSTGIEIIIIPNNAISQSMTWNMMIISLILSITLQV